MSNTQRSVMREISKIWMPLCLKKIFRAPARPTFVNSDKSRQKHRKEPPAPSLPSALCSVRTCDCIPHVHVKFPFSLRCRIVSAPAPLPLIPTPNNAFGSTVENVSGSGARGADDSSYVTISTVFCERVGYGIKFEGGTACRKSRNPGFWLSFWVLLGQRPKVPRPRRDETPLTRR